MWNAGSRKSKRLDPGLTTFHGDAVIPISGTANTNSHKETHKHTAARHGSTRYLPASSRTPGPTKTLTQLLPVSRVALMQGQLGPTSDLAITRPAPFGPNKIRSQDKPSWPRRLRLGSVNSQSAVYAFCVQRETVTRIKARWRSSWSMSRALKEVRMTTEIEGRKQSAEGFGCKNMSRALSRFWDKRRPNLRTSCGCSSTFGTKQNQHFPTFQQITQY